MATESGEKEMQLAGRHTQSRRTPFSHNVRNSGIARKGGLARRKDERSTGRWEEIGLT